MDLWAVIAAGDHGDGVGVGGVGRLQWGRADAMKGLITRWQVTEALDGERSP